MLGGWLMTKHDAGGLFRSRHGRLASVVALCKHPR
jgi:hypothetical protein